MTTDVLWMSGAVLATGAWLIIGLIGVVVQGRK
jgi:hypothetical protein